jgi:hypothetical protein
MNVVLPYHVGIKRRFLPGFRKISVLSHSFTQDGLELHRADGVQEMVTNLVLRRWVVYPDYWMTKAKIEAVQATAPQHQPAQEPIFAPPPYVPTRSTPAPSEQLQSILDLANQQPR